MVKVDQCDGLKPTTGQRFSCPGTDTANTHHSHMGLPDTQSASLPVQTGQTAKAPLRV
jgi:hypothetical protein